WTQDSQKVLVTAGSYKDTNYLVTPHVVTVNVVEIAVTVGPSLTDDPKSIVNTLMACDNTLFYKVTYENGGKFTPFLHSAPLADFSAKSGKINAGPDFRLLTCTPDR